MRKKTAHRAPILGARHRDLEAATQRSRLPSAATLRLALGAGLVVSGVFATSCSKRDDVTKDTPRRPATSTSAATTIASEESDPAGVCSASAHAKDKHLPPSEENMFLGGVTVPVHVPVEVQKLLPPQSKASTGPSTSSSKPCKCAPGDPLCEC